VFGQRVNVIVDEPEPTAERPTGYSVAVAEEECARRRQA
jgi:hypothetical protein